MAFGGFNHCDFKDIWKIIPNNDKMDDIIT